MKSLLASCILAAGTLVAVGAAAEPMGAATPTFGFQEDEPNYVPDEWVVDFQDDVEPTLMDRILGDVGLRREATNAWSDAHDRLARTRVPAARVSEIVAKLSADSRIEHVERMVVVRASFTPNDPLYAQQWHLPKVGAARAWEYGCGSGVTVAVIDTGIACYDRGAFSRGSDLTDSACVAGYDFVHDRVEAADDHGHGSHVAGTIAQATHNARGVAGLAHCARLMPIKVLSAGGWGTSAAVASGIRFAADHGAQIINLSLGSRLPSLVIASAVAHARRRGVLVVAAAGNSRRAVEYPAAYPGVLAVSAVDAQDEIAWFSSRGPQVALAAPGVDVTQQTICNGGQDHCETFATWSGTSMAAPHVAAGAALLMSTGVTDPAAVRLALTESARPKPERDKYGAGIMEVGAAMTHAHWSHFVPRLAALAVTIGWMRRAARGGKKLALHTSGLLAALFASVGLLAFLPLISATAWVGSGSTWVELLRRPFGEWSLWWSVGLHRYLPLANALPALVLAVTLFGVRRLRPVIGGFALGSAALLAQLTWSADVATPLPTLLLRGWLVLNLLVCLALARVTLIESRTS